MGGVRIAAGCVGLTMALAASAASAQVDIEGNWAARQHEDAPERGGGPEIGEYQGLPINEAARKHGDAWSASIWTVPEHQCIDKRQCLVLFEIELQCFARAANKVLCGTRAPFAPRN